MSSGLPINTFAQAKEYRDRYLAYLALEVQTDAYNLSANQVFKQTGQPSRPPDTRSTTEKLADMEGLKISLYRSLLGLTDGTQANETIEQLTPDELVFTSQQLPTITSELKPRFSKGVPAPALLNYIRALRRKELQTNGVSFTAQESTAQQILNAIQNGQAQMGGTGGPIPGGAGNPIGPGGVLPPGPPTGPPPPTGPTEDEQQNQAMNNAQQMRQRNIRKLALEFLDGVEYDLATLTPVEPRVKIAAVPLRSYPRDVQDMVAAIQAERGQGSSAGQALSVGRFRQDPMIARLAAEDVGLKTLDEWTNFPMAGGFGDYGESVPIAVEYLKIWARQQSPDIQSRFADGWQRKRTLATMKSALLPGWQFKQTTGALGPLEEIFAFDDSPIPTSPPTSVVGVGVRRMQPSSRFPTGRAILGYGMARPKQSEPTQRNSEYVGINLSEQSYSPFGKYVINTNKLASGILDVRTGNGKQLNKYKQMEMSPALAKTMKRIMGGRMIDEYDFNEMPMEDQNYLWNLAKDASIMDRLNLPTPKRTKDGEEENRFEILKGQIVAGNDSKELIKEFKTMLVKFSNDGRIKKSEAREILLDLAAMGH